MDNLKGKDELEKQQEELDKELDDRLEMDDLPTANIIVAGITGTGKSTLINAVFGSDMAATGRGKPVTEKINEYESEDTPVRIWDTVGLELDSQKTKESIAGIKATIASKVDSDNHFDRVHAIWYCINSGSNRYQGAELEFIKELYSIGVPFIIVLTQCSGDEEEVNTFENEIKRMNTAMGMNNIKIVQVLAAPVKYRGMPNPIPAFGLEELINVTLKLLPNFIRTSFIAAQKVSTVQKRKECEEILCSYVRKAQMGFFDKIVLINVFTTDINIMNMFKKIGTIYDTVLSEGSLKMIMKECGVNFKNNFFGLLSPIDMGYSKKITALLEQKKGVEGYSVEVSDVDEKFKAARMIAFYGYTFIDSIEEVWDELTEKDLKNVEKVVKELLKIINERLENNKIKAGGK